MRTRKYPMTPLAAVVGGLLAGAVGTVSMDTARYVTYRRAGGTDRRRGVAYGVLAGSRARPRVRYGPPFGAAVWAGSYVVLPAAGLYQPIWEYDAKTLAKDLSAHLAYGTGTVVTFWLLAKHGH